MKYFKKVSIVLYVFASLSFISCSRDKVSVKEEDKVAIVLEYNENKTIKKEIARQIVEDRSKEVINLLKVKDMKGLAVYIHPDKGVRFSPYTYVNEELDMMLDKESIGNALEDRNTYYFGVYDGIGDEIRYTWKEYFDEFVYSQDYSNAEQIGYNEVLSYGNMINNQFEVYSNPIVVEYYFSGFNKEFGGADWKSLKIVYEEYEGLWYVVGIIHNQWTV